MCVSWPLSVVVVAGGKSPLPGHARHPGGHEVGLARRQGHRGKAEGEETLAAHIPTGPIYTWITGC